jgi:hypothetical protein
MGREAMRLLDLTRPLAVVIAALMVAFAVPAVSAEVPRGATAITCTNPFSGVNWQINVDYDRSTVDSNPARISEAEISWQDEDRWNYKLDRKSGELTVVLASSTGGNFLHDRCKLEN